MSVTNCNIDMESLISDQNRSIATLAITTLLKTGNESSVDRLLKQVIYTCLHKGSCSAQYAIYTHCTVEHRMLYRVKWHSLRSAAAANRKRDYFVSCQCLEQHGYCPKLACRCKPV